MKNVNIQYLWHSFINDEKYKIFFTNDKTFDGMLRKTKKYMDDNNRRPSCHSLNIEEKKLGHWIHGFVGKHGERKKESEKIMFEEFITDEKYKHFFITVESKWLCSLNKTKHYIDTYNKRPTITNAKEIGHWVFKQHTDYLKKKNTMKNEDIYNQWTEFINDPKYIFYFKSNDEKYWNDTFNSLIQYINKYDKIPNSTDEDIIIKQLHEWIDIQLIAYKKKTRMMKNEIIYNKWNEFICNKKYKKYFKTKMYELKIF